MRMRIATFLTALFSAPLLVFALIGSDLMGVAPSAWSELIGWMYAQQRAFHRELTEALRLLTAGGGAAAAWTLVAASFLYGIFHAAGPGHGKAVLTAYLITHPEHLKRGAGLAAAAALCQGLVAIALVYGLLFLAGWLPRDAAQAVSWSERLSYGLVMIMGCVLMTKAARGGLRRLRVKHDRDVFEGRSPDVYHDQSKHACGCGHVHAPSDAQITQATDIRTTIGVILSIGLRPCSGAVLVLVFAKVGGLAWAGIGAVLAMSVGTASAIAVLALLAVNARSWAAAMIARRGVVWQAYSGVASFAGGMILAALGYALLSTSFTPSHPLGL